MAKGRIEKRHKSSYTLIIDEGFDPETGARKRWSTSVKTDDKEEAQRQLDIILGQIADKTFIKSPTVTVGAYFTNWLTTVEARTLAPKTLVSYRGCIELRIVPRLGHIKLGELTRSDLKNFYLKIYEVGRLKKDKEKKKEPTGQPEKIDQENKPVSKRTVELHHQVIRRVLNHAIYEDEILSKNVANRITIPDPPDHDFDEDEDIVKVFTADQITTLERHTVDTPYYALVALALRTGMRRSELLALAWDSIDFENGTVFIKRSVSYTPGNGCVYKATKNKKKRRIEVTEETLNILRNEKAKQDKYKDSLETEEEKDQYNPDNLVLCWEDGQPIHPDTPSTWFPDFCIACGLPRLTFHCLRHTHASHLLAEGEDISYVSKRLGHSDITITYKTYFHFIPLEKRDSIQKLDSKFKK